MYGCKIMVPQTLCRFLDHPVINHNGILIIFPVILQTVISFRMLSEILQEMYSTASRSLLNIKVIGSRSHGFFSMFSVYTLLQLPKDST